MSERQYFSLRYAVPGYALILVVIGINYVPLLELLKITGLNSAFGSFLAFLSLFAGSALGFLISQVWWCKYNEEGGLFWIKETEAQLNMLIDKYRLIEPKDKIKKKKVLMAFDHIVQSKKNRELNPFAARRWDMYHLLSSTYYTLWIALGLGVLFRIYYEFHLFRTPIPEIVCNSLKQGELIALMFIILSIAYLLCILRKGRQNIATEYALTMEMRVRNSDVTKEDLRKVLPSAIRNQDRNEQSGYIS